MATGLLERLPAALSAPAPDSGGSDSSRAALIGEQVRVTTTTVIGATVGGFVGSRIRSPKWEEVSLSTGGP